MDMRIEPKGLTSLEAYLEGVPERIQDALVEKMRGLTSLLFAKVTANVSGGKLNVDTGKLRDSLFQNLEVTEDRITGTVGVSKPTKAAFVQEYGGDREYEIVPVDKSVLYFYWDVKGQYVFLPIVHRKPLIAREYLRSALRDLIPEFQEVFSTLIQDIS